MYPRIYISRCIPYAYTLTHRLWTACHTSFSKTEFFSRTVCLPHPTFLTLQAGWKSKAFRMLSPLIPFFTQNGGQQHGGAEGRLVSSSWTPAETCTFRLLEPQLPKQGLPGQSRDDRIPGLLGLNGSECVILAACKKR